MDKNDLKPSIEEILAEAKAKSQAKSQTNITPNKNTSDLINSLSLSDESSSLNSLDVYIKFGQSNKSVSEITNEIKNEIEKSQQPSKTASSKSSFQSQTQPETNFVSSQISEDKFSRVSQNRDFEPPIKVNKANDSFMSENKNNKNDSKKNKYDSKYVQKIVFKEPVLNEKSVPLKREREFNKDTFENIKTQSQDINRDKQVNLKNNLNEKNVNFFKSTINSSSKIITEGEVGIQTENKSVVSPNLTFNNKNVSNVSIDNSPTQDLSKNEVQSSAQSIKETENFQKSPSNKNPLRNDLNSKLNDTTSFSAPKMRKFFDTFTGRTGDINAEMIRKTYDSDQRRKKRLEEFFTIDEELSPTEKKIQNQAQKRVDDYDSYEDTEKCSFIISSAHSKNIFKFFSLLVLSLVSLYISFSSFFQIGEIELISLSSEPNNFCMVQLILSILTAFFSFKTICGGFFSTFSFSPSTDSFVSISFIASFVHNLYLMLSPEIFDQVKNPIIFTPIAIFALCLNALGKVLNTNRIKQNFKFVSSKYDKFAATIIDSEQVNLHLNRLSTYSEANTIAFVETEFLSDYFKNADTIEPSEKMNRILTPIMLLISLGVGAGYYFFKPNIYFALTSAIGFLVVSCPLVSCFSSSFILNRLSNKLFKKGAIVSGYEAVQLLSDTNGIIIDAKDLFPMGTVTLHGVKTFGGERIDEAIVDVASVVHAAKGTYSDMFMAVIEGKSEILKDVETFIYEDGMGISAWIDSQRILIGNAKLLTNHGIEVPSKDYESRYIGKSRELMYLSISGTLSAMFILKYTPDLEVKKSLEKLEKSGYDIFIKTNDSNITADKIAEIYDINKDIFKIIPGSAYSDLSKETDKTKRMPAIAAHSGSFVAFVNAVYGSSKVKSAIKLSIILQLVGVVFCALVMVFLAFSSDTTKIMNIVVVFLLQVFWAVLTMIFPNISDL